MHCDQYRFCRVYLTLVLNFCFTLSHVFHISLLFDSSSYLCIFGWFFSSPNWSLSCEKIMNVNKCVCMRVLYKVWCGMFNSIHNFTWINSVVFLYQGNAGFWFSFFLLLFLNFLGFLCYKISWGSYLLWSYKFYFIFGFLI